MAKPRTEEEILAQAPLMVTFGQKQYEIKPLTILKSRSWRKQLVETLGSIIDTFLQTSTTLPQTSELLSSGIIGALVQCPEKITDLLFAYAPNLPAQEILENATEDQVIFAFEGVMAMSFPFLGLLGTMRAVVGSSSLQKANYTN